MGESLTLGTVIAPSGTVLVYDFGNLGWWRAFDQTPSGDPCVDLVFGGPDAERAATHWGAPSSRIHDVPEASAATASANAVARLAKEGFTVTLATAPPLSPIARIRAALARAPHACLSFGGLTGIAVSGVPTTPLTVRGEKDESGRWAQVVLDVREGALARTDDAGRVFVDWARLAFVDPAALDGWRHDEATDGRADFVFWGRDAAEAAKVFEAPALDASTFGWVDRTVAEIVALGRPVNEWKTTNEKKMATDFRPHSDHYRLMARVRTTPTESGTLALGEASMCGFMTSWGDGAFPVLVDRDADGSVLRVRVELAPTE